MKLDLDDGVNMRSLSLALSEKMGNSKRGNIGSYRLDEGELVILVNGRNIDTLEGLDTQLRDGDSVTLLPPFAGG